MGDITTVTVSSTEPLLTEDEYLAFDLAHEGKHEFVPGRSIVMAWASPEHALVTTNLAGLVGIPLRGSSFRLFGRGLRVRIDETGLYAYPDLIVYRGTPVFADTNPRSLLNPSVLFEVLSDSTEAWDRGVKAVHYRRRSSVDAYVIISWKDRRVEHYARGAAGTWLLTETAGEGEICLSTLGVTLSLAELFEGLLEVEAAVKAALPE